MSKIKVNSLEGVGASTPAISIDNASGTCTANITNNLSNRNLIINGAMQVAQRGTSSTSSGYQTVDRFKAEGFNTGQTTTQSHQDLSSSDTPYTLGFRKYMRIALASSGTANASAGVELQQRIEAQDIANSGWNYNSASSDITLQFWFRCSTNQTFYGYLYTFDGTLQLYCFSFTASANNTWTKITKTIPGNSNLTFNNDNGPGLQLKLIPFYGTDYTNNLTLNQWGAFVNGNQMPDMASTWLTTGTPTFDVTGVQFEVGSVATDFEHRSYSDELRRCLRYYFRIGYGTQYCGVASGLMSSTTQIRPHIRWPAPMRSAPTINQSGLNVDNETAAAPSITGIANQYSDNFCGRLNINCNTASFGAGTQAQIYTSNTTSYLEGSSEL